MKPRSLLCAFCLSASLASHAAGAQPEVRYAYDDKFTWDKKALDAPPLLVGGEAAFAPRLGYPRDLRRRRIEGKAIVSVLVHIDGSVGQISFTPRLRSELEKIVIQAVRQSRWKPGKKRGAPKEGTVSFPVTFRISAS